MRCVPFLVAMLTQIAAIAQPIPTPALPVTITPPAERLSLGEYAQIKIGNVTPGMLPSLVLDVWPEKGVVMIPAQTWGGDPLLLFSAKQPGDYRILLAYPNGGKPGVAKCVVGVGGDPVPPGPGPGPGPDPNPPPTPPGPSGFLAALEAATIASVKKLPASAKTDAIAVADVFDSTAKYADGKLTTPLQLINATKGARRMTLGPVRDDAWTPFSKEVGAFLDGRKADVADMPSAIVAWRTIASSIRKAVTQ